MTLTSLAAELAGASIALRMALMSKACHVSRNDVYRTRPPLRRGARPYQNV
jgi:hypothetical protein